MNAGKRVSNPHPEIALNFEVMSVPVARQIPNTQSNIDIFLCVCVLVYCLWRLRTNRKNNLTSRRRLLPSPPHPAHSTPPPLLLFAQQQTRSAAKKRSANCIRESRLNERQRDPPSADITLSNVCMHVCACFFMLLLTRSGNNNNLAGPVCQPGSNKKQTTTTIT